MYRIQKEDIRKVQTAVQTINKAGLKGTVIRIVLQGVGEVTFAPEDGISFVRKEILRELEEMKSYTMEGFHSGLEELANMIFLDELYPIKASLLALRIEVGKTLYQVGRVTREIEQAVSEEVKAG